MSLHDYIGQQQIVTELLSVSSGLKSRKVTSLNILLRSSPGMGKTLLAKQFAKSISSLYSYQVVKNSTLFDKKMATMQVHIIDEIHCDKNIESLYPLMDANKYVFIFCTTDSGELPDAFISRCISLSFRDYTDSEMGKILYSYARRKQYNFTKDVCDLIATYSRGSPRIGKQTLDRVALLIDRDYNANTVAGVKTALKNIGIYEGGYTDLDIRYLQTLEDRGRLSLDNLSRILRIDKLTLTTQIEPFLIMRGDVSITSRGRQRVI